MATPEVGRGQPDPFDRDERERAAHLRHVEQLRYRLQRSLGQAQEGLHTFQERSSGVIQSLANETKRIAAETEGVDLTALEALSSEMRRHQTRTYSFLQSIERVQTKIEAVTRVTERVIRGYAVAEDRVRRRYARLEDAVRRCRAKGAAYEMSKERVRRAFEKVMALERRISTQIRQKLRDAERSRTRRYVGGYVATGGIFAIVCAVCVLFPPGIPFFIKARQKLADIPWEPYERGKALVRRLESARDDIEIRMEEARSVRGNLLSLDWAIQPAMVDITMAIESMEEYRALRMPEQMALRRVGV